MTPAIEQQLAALLEAGDGMYRISEVKHEPKDFSYKELRQEAARRKVFHPLYDFAQTFLASAALSNESVKYYASLVQFYTVYKLQRMASGIVQLYLLCFAYYRFRQINDNLAIVAGRRPRRVRSATWGHERIRIIKIPSWLSRGVPRLRR